MPPSRIFLKALTTQTAQIVTGSIVASAGLSWGLLTWIFPTLKWPLFQPWMLFLLGTLFYWHAAYLAWFEEWQRGNRVTTELTTLSAAHSASDLQVNVGGYYLAANTPGDDKPLPGVWLVFHGVDITNASDQQVQVELRMVVGLRTDGRKRYSDLCQATFPSWVLPPPFDRKVPITRTLNIAGRSTRSGVCITKLPHDILSQAAVPSTDALAGQRPYWLEVRNSRTGECRSCSMNYNSAYIDHQDQVAQSVQNV